MAHSLEEIEFARKTAKGAEKLLPTLMKEYEDLKRRIEKLQQHVADYKSMVGDSPESPAAAPPKSGRAKRGEPKAHFLAILKDSPNLDNDQLIAKVSERFGVTYASSTAYRNIAAAKEEMKVLSFKVSLAS